uniref:C6 transcription factor n=1 Tax=Melanopsichium pennsylvanicum 4 TaxID=1398559 RepID=A0A077R7W7_9BASI|nr:c6 transcription factor [Melanopsichium pennsylvanicum 4]
MTPSSSVASTSTAISNTSSSKVAKRKRVSRACDQCYQKKDKCDGLTPVCTFCAQSERKCTYDRPERKRGPTQGLRPRLEQRILALETVLGFVLGQLKHERVKIDVDQLKNAGQADKAKFRKQGWLYSDVKQELVDVLGGSSLNRGLVPRGADPNAVLGGFTIEFGGNQTDEDWIRSEYDCTSNKNNKTQSINV